MGGYLVWTILGWRSLPMKTVLLVAVLVSTLVGPSLAQVPPGLPDAARGKVLAERWCGACHLVQLRLTAIDPPTFSAIANDPSRTPAYLRAFFASPHKDMPPIQLTAPQVEDIIAYLGT
jgi:mono/diheme cytochrome c family protein